MRWLMRLAVNRMQRKAFDNFASMFGQGYQQREQTARQPHRGRKKKIDPSVGEYVAFEEVAEETTTTTATGQQTTFTAESQVEDAVWEEIE